METLQPAISVDAYEASSNPKLCNRTIRVIRGKSMRNLRVVDYRRQLILIGSENIVFLSTQAY